MINMDKAKRKNDLICQQYTKIKVPFAHESLLPLVAPTLMGAYNTVHTATALRAFAQIRLRRTSYAPIPLYEIAVFTILI
ncbi:hypothetical protein ES705_38540 [subsurface metagenome]